MIDNTYYTANNYLMGKTAHKQEFLNLKKRIHYSEAISVLGVYSFIILFVLLILCATVSGIFAIAPMPREEWSQMRCRAISRWLVRLREHGDIQSDLNNRWWISSWMSLRWGRASLLLIGIAAMTIISSYAWSLDEKSYDQRVFGYYLAELEVKRNCSDDADSLARTTVPSNAACDHYLRGNLLRGIKGTDRFDASGASWLGNGESRHFVVVNDKDGRLTVHDESGNLLEIIDLGEAMAKEIARWREDAEEDAREFPDEVRDLEAIGRIGDGKYLLLGSHSTWQQARDYRRRYTFEIELSGTETKPGDWDFTASLSESDLFAEALLRSVQLEGSDTGVERDLASGWLEPGRDCCDVNIEGVTQGPVTDASGETEIMRLFALREPLFCEAGKAVSRVYGVDIDGTALRRLIDLPAVIDDENVPGPHRLSDIAYDSNSKSYWLLTSVERSDEVDKDRVMAPCSIAGSASRGADKGGALWRWDGDPTHQPNLVSVTAFHKPEGIAVSADGRLVVVYDDDGDSPKCGGVPLAPYSIGENLPNHRLWQECGALLPACQGNN